MYLSILRKNSPNPEDQARKLLQHCIVFCLSHLRSAFQGRAHFIRDPCAWEELCGGKNLGTQKHDCILVSLKPLKILKFMINHFIMTDDIFSMDVSSSKLLLDVRYIISAQNDRYYLVRLATDCPLSENIPNQMNCVFLRCLSPRICCSLVP